MRLDGNILNHLNQLWYAVGSADNFLNCPPENNY